MAGGRVWFIDPNRENYARMPATKFAKLAEKGQVEATMILTATEEGFFDQLRVPCWPPEQRTERRLMQFVRRAEQHRR